MKENQQIIYYKRDGDDEEKAFVPEFPYCHLVDESGGEFYEDSIREIAQDIAKYEYYQDSRGYLESIKICITRVSTEEKPVNMVFYVWIPEFYADKYGF